MLLSKSTKYAIKAVIYLALNSSESEKILVRDMYEQVNVSEPYLSKILAELSRHRVISSSKGRNGGFFISKENLQRSLLDIVYVMEGKASVDSCVLGIKNCDERTPCVLHDLVGPSKSSFKLVLQNTLLGDLSEKFDGKNAMFPL